MRPASPATTSEPSHFVYVDSLGVIGVCEQSAGAALKQLEEGFNREGLLLHKFELSRNGIVALGTELDGAALRTRVTPERFWAIRVALEALLRRRRISAWSLEVVLGHCTFAALCFRGLLSVFTRSTRSWSAAAHRAGLSPCGMSAGRSCASSGPS